MREIKFRIWVPYNKKMLDWKYVHISFFHDKECYTLLQFTGLKDKNGKEIYEGDIIEADWNDKRYETSIFEVQWDEEDCCFAFNGGSPSKDAEYNFEVIGNIYENPELLEAKI